MFEGNSNVASGDFSLRGPRILLFNKIIDRATSLENKEEINFPILSAI